MSIMEATMTNPDEAMDSMTVLYSPNLEPLTLEDMAEIAELFAFLCEDEKAA